MTRIAVIGAGLGGMSAAYELRDTLGKDHEITVIGQGPKFGFTPSNPWLAVGWRKPDRHHASTPVTTCETRHHLPRAAGRAHRCGASNLHLADGEVIGYDYLLICTGPKLDFAAITGLGPEGGSYPVRVHHRSRRACQAGLRTIHR